MTDRIANQHGRAFIAGRAVGCLPISLDRYGHTGATCSVGDVDSEIGLFGTASPGLDDIQNGSTIEPSTKPNEPDAGFGQAATSSRGYIGSAL